MKAFNSQKKANLGLSSKDNYTKPVLLATLLATALVSTSVAAYDNTLAKELTASERKQEKQKMRTLALDPVLSLVG